MQSKIIVALIIVFCALGCKTAKDIKATNRVLTNPELKEKVGRAWEKENPCVNDSVAVYIKGDTLTHIDTLYSNDTVKIIKSVPYEVIKTRTITVTKLIRDTVKIAVTDTRRLNIALDSLNYYTGLFQQRDAQVNEFTRDKKDVTKAFGWLLIALVRKWWFWLIVILLAGYLTRKLWTPRIPFLNR